ncbi:hypothetical protein AGR4B_pAt20354 [Agrobacterium tumefaciens str. CFBP 5621]|nr:hypothetical protein AGR4B_pAt20354 [Agrobacterium tumefaciens str. CFBP 5621]
MASPLKEAVCSKSVIAPRQPHRSCSKTVCDAIRRKPELKQSTAETIIAVDLEASLVPGADHDFYACPGPSAAVIPPLLGILVQTCRTSASMHGIAHE